MTLKDKDSIIITHTLVFSSIMALLSRSNVIMLFLPHLDATWSGVMLFWKTKNYLLHKIMLCYVMFI